MLNNNEIVYGKRRLDALIWRNIGVFPREVNRTAATVLLPTLHDETAKSMKSRLNGRWPRRQAAAR